MFQFVYISTAARNRVEDQVDDILALSRRNNSGAGVTGVLLHRGRRFLQVLEGDRDDVMTTVARIERDPRHIAIVPLSTRETAVREFGDWSMASDRDQSPADVLARIDLLTKDANANLRAQFMSYAALQPSA